MQRLSQGEFAVSTCAETTVTLSRSLSGTWHDAAAAGKFHTCKGVFVFAAALADVGVISPRAVAAMISVFVEMIENVEISPCVRAHAAAGALLCVSGAPSHVPVERVFAAAAAVAPFYTCTVHNTDLTFQLGHAREVLTPPVLSSGERAQPCDPIGLAIACLRVQSDGWVSCDPAAVAAIQYVACRSARDFEIAAGIVPVENARDIVMLPHISPMLLQLMSPDMNMHTAWSVWSLVIDSAVTIRQTLRHAAQHVAASPPCPHMDVYVAMAIVGAVLTSVSSFSTPLLSHFTHDFMRGVLNPSQGIASLNLDRAVVRVCRHVYTHVGLLTRDACERFAFWTVGIISPRGLEWMWHDLSDVVTRDDGDALKQFIQLLFNTLTCVCCPQKIAVALNKFGGAPLVRFLPEGSDQYWPISYWLFAPGHPLHEAALHMKQLVSLQSRASSATLLEFLHSLPDISAEDKVGLLVESILESSKASSQHTIEAFARFFEALQGVCTDMSTRTALLEHVRSFWQSLPSAVVIIQGWLVSSNVVSCNDIVTWGSAQPNGGLVSPPAWALVRDFFSRLSVRMEKIVCDLNEEMDKAESAPADSGESRLEKIQEALKGR